MAFVRRDFVKETSTVTGTGAITLLGARVPAQTFASVCANGDTFRYAISNQSGPNEWEVGLGTYNSGANTITRSPVASSNGGGLVNFSIGTKFVDIVVDTAQFDAFLTTAGAGGGVAISASGSSQSAGTVVFSNLAANGGVSFGMNGSTVTASVRPAFSQMEIGAFGTSFTTLTASSINASDALAVRYPEMATSLDSLFSYPNVLWRFQTGGVQHSARQVAFQRYFGTGIVGGVSAQQVSFANSNNVTIGITSSTFANFGVVPIYTLSASDVRLGVVSHIGGDVVSSVTQLAFSNASNVTFSLSTAAGAATVLASVAAGGGGGGLQFNLESTYNRSQFTAYTDTTVSGGTVGLFSNSLGTVNLQQINVQFRASGSALVAAAHIFAFGTDTADNASVQGVQLLNSNGVTFGLSRITNGVFGRFAQYTASYTVPTHTLAMSAAGASVSNGTVVFSNSNNVSFGQAGSTVTATATVAATRDIGVVSHIGGNVVSSVSQIAFSNANGVTFSLSTAANAATVIASVNAGGGAGFTHSGFLPHFGAAVIVTQSLSNGSVWVQPLNDAPDFQFDRIGQLFGLSNATNATNSNTLRYFLGVYTRNVSTLSLVASASFSTAFTGSGTVGNYSLFSGPRNLTMGMTNTLGRSDYWIACGASLATAGNNSFSVSFGMLSQSLSNQVYGLGLASNATYQSLLGKGFYTATSSAAPGSIAFSQVNGTNSVAYRFPAIYFGSGTA